MGWASAGPIFNNIARSGRTDLTLNQTEPPTDNDVVEIQETS